MADPKIKFDIEAQATGAAEVEKLEESIKGLGKSLDGELKRDADAAAQALRNLADQSKTAATFEAVGRQVLQAGGAFKEAQAKLRDLDKQFAEAATAVAQFASAEQAAMDDVRTTTRELGAAKVALAQVDSAYDRAGRNTAEYAAATGALKLNIAKLTADLREKKNTLEDTAKGAKAAVREEAALGQQQQKLTNEVGLTRKAYADSNRALDEAKTALKAAGIDSANFAAEQRRLGTETEAARKAVAGLAASFTAMVTPSELPMKRRLQRRRRGRRYPTPSAHWACAAPPTCAPKSRRCARPCRQWRRTLALPAARSKKPWAQEMAGCASCSESCDLCRAN